MRHRMLSLRIVFVFEAVENVRVFSGTDYSTSSHVRATAELEREFRDSIRCLAFS